MQYKTGCLKNALASFPMPIEIKIWYMQIWESLRKFEILIHQLIWKEISRYKSLTLNIPAYLPT